MKYPGLGAVQSPLVLLQTSQPLVEVSVPLHYTALALN